MNSIDPWEARASSIRRGIQSELGSIRLGSTLRNTDGSSRAIVSPLVVIVEIPLRYASSSLKEIETKVKEILEKEKINTTDIDLYSICRKHWAVLHSKELNPADRDDFLFLKNLKADVIIHAGDKDGDVFSSLGCRELIWQ